jgi:hypothetical protein
VKYAVGDAQPVLIQLPKPTKAGKVQQFDSTAVVP